MVQSVFCCVLYDSLWVALININHYYLSAHLRQLPPVVQDIYKYYMYMVSEVDPMVSVWLQPPTSFDFTKPEQWTRWKTVLSCFWTHQKDETYQDSKFLYCMDEETDDILSTTEITDEESKKYETVVQKFDGFFKSVSKCHFWTCTVQPTLPASWRDCQAINHCSIRAHRNLWVLNSEEWSSLWQTGSGNWGPGTGDW